MRVNPKHLIAPAVALLIAGILVGGQRQKISRLEGESNLLRKYIATEKSLIESRELTANPLRPRRSEVVGEEVDWMELAGLFAEIRSGGGDRRKMISIQRKFLAMDQEELLAGLDQLQTLDPNDEGREMLISMIVGILAEKAPEVVLARFSDALGNGGSGMSWQLAKALQSWAEKDLAAATEWFDTQIAAGTFESKSLDGRSSIRLRFEANLIFQLLSTDPEAAGARVASLPADRRIDVLWGGGYGQLKEEDRIAHAALVREYLSEQDRYRMFGQQASNIAGVGDFEAVTKYLDDISATGEERVKAAEQAAESKLTRSSYLSKITDEKVDSMREWLGGQAPDSVERVTGESLAQVARNENEKFSKITAMVLKYHDQNGSDQLLTSFLDRTYRYGDPEELRKLAERISDPEKREEALGRLK